MRLNIPKIEVMCISSTTGLKITVLLNDSPLNKVTSKHCLGVILNVRLSFNLHIEQICSIALRALNKVGYCLQDAL